MTKSTIPKRNLKIPPQLLPPVQQKDLASQMKGLKINRPNLTIRKPAEVRTDINKELDRINKRIKGRRANVNDVMKQLRNMNVKVTEQKTEKKGGRKTRRKHKANCKCFACCGGGKKRHRKRKKKTKKKRKQKGGHNEDELTGLSPV